MDLVDVLRENLRHIDDEALWQILWIHDRRFVKPLHQGPRIITNPMELDPDYVKQDYQSLPGQFLDLVRKSGCLPKKLPWDSLVVFDCKAKPVDWYWKMNVRGDIRDGIGSVVRGNPVWVRNCLMEYIASTLAGYAPSYEFSVRVRGQALRIYQTFQKIDSARVMCLMEAL